MTPMVPSGSARRHGMTPTGDEIPAHGVASMTKRAQLCYPGMSTGSRAGVIEVLCRARDGVQKAME
jgi:hypothetical protein